MLLGIKWYQFVRNDDVQRLRKQPKLTAIIQSRRLALFWHIMRMDDNADAKRILLASPPTRSSPHHVAQHRPTGSETTPPYALRSSRFGSVPPSVEDDVDVWLYAIVSCMPETTTIRSLERRARYLFYCMFVFWVAFLSTISRQPAGDLRQILHAGVLWFRMCLLPFWGLAAPLGPEKGGNVEREWRVCVSSTDALVFFYFYANVTTLRSPSVVCLSVCL